MAGEPLDDSMIGEPERADVRNRHSTRHKHPSVSCEAIIAHALLQRVLLLRAGHIFQQEVRCNPPFKANSGRSVNIRGSKYRVASTADGQEPIVKTQFPKRQEDWKETVEHRKPYIYTYGRCTLRLLRDHDSTLRGWQVGTRTSAVRKIKLPIELV